MAAAKRLNRDRLVRIANLFSSPVVGERAAAASAFLRALHAVGSTPEDFFLGFDDTASEPKPTHKPKQKADKGQGGFFDHRQDAAKLLARAADVLTPFEKSFLHGVVTYRELSDKQRIVFEQIRTKAADRGRGL